MKNIYPILYIFQLNKLAKNKQGFTLIELMIIVSVISILAVIAIPIYLRYVARAQVTEAINILGGAHPNLVEFVADYGRLPDDNEFQQFIPLSSSLTTQTKYIKFFKKVSNINYNGTILSSYVFI